MQRQKWRSIQYHTCSQLPIVKVSLVQFRAKLAVFARENIAKPSDFVGINVPGTYKSAQSVLGACLLCKLNERGSFVCFLREQTCNIPLELLPLYARQLQALNLERSFRRDSSASS
jgi:hypothetical protein